MRSLSGFSHSQDQKCDSRSSLRSVSKALISLARVFTRHASKGPPRSAKVRQKYLISDHVSLVTVLIESFKISKQVDHGSAVAHGAEKGAFQYALGGLRNGGSLGKQHLLHISPLVARCWLHYGESNLPASTVVLTEDLLQVQE